MGWRQALGCEAEKLTVKTYPQKPQKEQNIHTEPPFAPIAPIADRPQTLKKAVFKMSVCLHGIPCHSLFVKDDRQVCRRNGQAVFDMASCPIGKWFKVNY
jgi:hypothetical protein